MTEDVDGLAVVLGLLFGNEVLNDFGQVLLVLRVDVAQALEALHEAAAVDLLSLVRLEDIGDFEDLLRLGIEMLLVAYDLLDLVYDHEIIIMKSVLPDIRSNNIQVVVRIKPEQGDISVDECDASVVTVADRLFQFDRVLPSSAS